MAYALQKETFEAVNNDLRLQQEAARQKQLDQQRNQVFNDAKADVELFEGTKTTIMVRSTLLEARITELEGAAVIDQDELQMRRDQLRAQNRAL
jgi:hypothetical protein